MKKQDACSHLLPRLSDFDDIQGGGVVADTIKAPSCHLSWTVTRVSQRLFAVAATLNGADYDFVGNFQSLREAHAAGRLYASDLAHRDMRAAG